jgi:hypothetical protein
MKKNSKKEEEKKLKADENKKADNEIANKKANDNETEITLSSWRIKNSIPKGMMKSFLSKTKFKESELDQFYEDFLQSPIKIEED